MCDPIQVTLLKMRPHYSQSSRENATPSSDTSPLASYKELPSPFPPGSYFWKHLRHFCWSNLIKVKRKAKEGKNPIGSAFSWSVGRRVDCCFTWVSFVQVLLFCEGKCKLTFILKLVLQFLVDPVSSWQIKRTDGDYLGIFNQGRYWYCIAWSYTWTPMFLYLRNAFGSLISRKLLSKDVSF